MFCEKCGQALDDDAEICVNCGARTAKAENENQDNAEAQPVPQKPFTEKTNAELMGGKQPKTDGAPAENDASAEPKSGNLSNQDAKSSVETRVAQKDSEKKGLSKPALIAIIASAAVVLLTAALILIFAVVVPSFEPKVGFSKYITLNFESKEQYDGSIWGVVTVDREAFERDYADGDSFDLVRSGSLDRLFSEISFEYSVEGSEDNSGYGSGAVVVSNLKKDDVLNLTVAWEDFDDAKRIIDAEERICGFSFDKEPITLKLSVEDYIKEQGLELNKPVELNILDYVRSNDLVITVPNEDGLTVGIDSFNTKIGGYTVKNDSFFESSALIYDKDGEYLTSVYFNFEGDEKIAEGDTVRLKYSGYNSSARDNGFLLTGEPVEYTVVKPEILSADSAEKHIEVIKKYIAENLRSADEDFSDGDTAEIGGVYFAADKKDEAFSKLIAVYTNKTKKYSKTLELSSDGFFSGDRFVFYGYTELGGKEKTLDDALKANELASGKNSEYTTKKIL